MQKNILARIVLLDKKYLLTVKSKVLDGRIFLTGKVDNPEEKLKLTKLAWENYSEQINSLIKEIWKVMSPQNRTLGGNLHIKDTALTENTCSVWSTRTFCTAWI